MNGSGSVLIPDGETYFTVKVLRCLSRVPGISTYILSRTRSSVARSSRYCSGCRFHESENDRDWIEVIKNIVGELKIDIVLPATDTGFDFIVRNQEVVSKFAAVPSLPDYELFRMVNDKWSFYCFAEEHGIPVPSSIFVGRPGQPLSDVQDLDSIQFPALLKPTELSGGFGILEVKDPSDLSNAWADGRVIKNRRYVLQSYVPGVDLSLYQYSKDGEMLAYTLQRSLSHPSSYFGPQKVMEFIDNRKVVELGARLVKTMKWNGVACIDFRFDMQDETEKIIDFNPRFGQALLGALVAGVNFPLMACLDALGADYPDMHQDAVRYAHPATHGKMLISQLFGHPAMKLTWREGGLRFMAQDPMPELLDTVRKLVRRLT